MADVGWVFGVGDGSHGVHALAVRADPNRPLKPYSCRAFLREGRGGRGMLRAINVTCAPRPARNRRKQGCSCKKCAWGIKPITCLILLRLVRQTLGGGTPLNLMPKKHLGPAWSY